MQAELENLGDATVKTKKQRRKKQKLFSKELLVDYAKNSTLHGFRYIVEQGLSTVEKIFWLTFLVASFVMCSYYIYNVCQKWITSPVIVAVNEKLSSVETVPFPSVTICPQITVTADAYNFKENYDNYTKNGLGERELLKLLHVYAVCDRHYRDIDVNGTYHYDASFITDMTEVAPSLGDIMVDCRWYRKRVACSELFSKVYTRDGLCYTFNTLAATEIFENTTQQEYQYLETDITSKGWSVGSGYDYSLTEQYPRRGRVYGSFPDLDLMFRHDKSQRQSSCNLRSGYKVYLHHPTDIPQSSLNYFVLNPDLQASMALNFNEFKTDPNLSAYSPDKRQCYFPMERKLRYFKIYTMKNCQAECLTNFTLTLCKCVGFYMPHNDSTQICREEENKDSPSCSSIAKDTMASAEIDDEVRIKSGVKEACRCLPACDAVEYDADIMSKTQDYYVQEPFPNNLFYYTYSNVYLYFKKPHYMTIQRRELFGVTDVLANIGGLLGLFLGFSFLSLVEIIYFMTLRCGFTLKRNFEEEKAMKRVSSNKY